MGPHGRVPRTRCDKPIKQVPAWRSGFDIAYGTKGRMTEPSATGSELDRLPPMTHYVVGILRRSPTAPSRTESEAAALQEAHLAHLRRLRESQELITTGPVEEDGELRGLLIFRTELVSYARDLMRTDPLVSGGFLRLELYTWFSPAGLSLAASTPAGTELTFESD